MALRCIQGDNGSSQREGVPVLGEYVRRIREQRGLRQEDLSYAIGQDRNYISRLETGRIKKFPEPNVLRALADELKVSEVDLLRSHGYMQDVTPQQPRLTPEVVNRIADRVRQITFEEVVLEGVAEVGMLADELDDGDDRQPAPEVIRTRRRATG